MTSLMARSHLLMRRGLFLPLCTISSATCCKLSKAGDHDRAFFEKARITTAVLIARRHLSRGVSSGSLLSAFGSARSEVTEAGRDRSGLVIQVELVDGFLGHGIDTGVGSKAADETRRSGVVACL
jgi:hypothetical protein